MIEKIYNNKPIEDLGLSTRSHNALRRAGIDTVGELRRAYKNNILVRVRGLGNRSISEIEELLLKYIEKQQEESDG